MQNAILTWSDPSGPLTGVEIAVKVSGAPDFTPVSVVSPGVQTLTIPDLVDGDYEFRAVCINGSKRSSGRTVTGKVESAPGEVSGLAVAFS